MQWKTAAALAWIGAFLGGCASVQMPSNVTIRATDSHAGVIEAIDMSYDVPGAVDYGRLRECVAENVTNDEVTLQGSAAFHRNALGLIQSENSSDVVQAGSLVKYQDDARKVMIVSGTTRAGGDSLGIVRWLLKYQLRVSATDHRTGLVFTNIREALQNTGNSANDGFNPVGTWAGGGGMRIYGAIEAVANSIKGCAG